MMQFEALLFRVSSWPDASFRARAGCRRPMDPVLRVPVSLSSVRHVPVFVDCDGSIDRGRTEPSGGGTGPGCDRKNSVARNPQPNGRGFRLRIPRSSGWPVLVVLVLALMGPPIPWPKDFPKEIFPVAMVHAHAAGDPRIPVLTTDQWADYLIYTNPQQKVFVDGRSDFYGPEIGKSNTFT